jgi:hypothetical protein
METFAIEFILCGWLLAIGLLCITVIAIWHPKLFHSLLPKWVQSDPLQWLSSWNWQQPPAHWKLRVIVAVIALAIPWLHIPEFAAKAQWGWVVALAWVSVNAFVYAARILLRVRRCLHICFEES